MSDRAWALTGGVRLKTTNHDNTLTWERQRIAIFIDRLHQTHRRSPSFASPNFAGCYLHSTNQWADPEFV